MMRITEQAMTGFSQYLYEEEKSKNTIDKYMRDLRFFVTWLGDRNLDKSLVLEYKQELISKYAPASVNSMLSSLNAFFTHLNWHELRVKTIKIQRLLFMDKEKELSKVEYERLLTAALSRHNEQMYYLMQTIASTGIRISELSAITVEAVAQGHAIIYCKGKMRKVFLPQPLCKMLKEYMKSQGIGKGSIFVSRSGAPLDRTRVWRLLKELCDTARVSKEKVFPHNFRHLFARTFYSLQKDIVRLADVLGHASVNTTRIYTMESGEVHKMQLEKMGLLCNVKRPKSDKIGFAT